MSAFHYLTLFLMLFLGLFPAAYGAREAFIITERAVLYADKGLEAPIGFVRKGKEVWVGEVPRVNGTILPIIVAGKVAYIKVEDLAYSYNDAIFSQGPQATEHKYFNQESKEFDDPMSENNDVMFTYGVFRLGSQWSSFSQSVGSTGTENGSFLRLVYEHRHPFKRINWGLGAGLYSLTGANSAFSMYTIDIQLNVVAARWEHFQIEVPITIAYGPKVTVETKTPAFQKSGSMIGFIGGLQARLFPKYKLGFIAGWSYHSFLFNGFKAISGTGANATSLNKSGDQKYYLGIHYKI